MKSLILVFCLAQLWGCHAVSPPMIGLLYREVNCDDPESEQAAMVAMDYLNKNLFRGYKHALNRIEKVKVWPRRPFGEVFEMELDTLETTCHALDPTPAANCSVRPLVEHAVEGDCDFRVLKQAGQFTVLSVKCDSSPDSREDLKKMCPDCPVLAPLNHTKVVHAADAALKAFNTQTNGSYFQLVELTRANIGYLSRTTYVEFAMAATDCAAQEVTDPTKCNLLAEKQYGFCKGTVTEIPRQEKVSVTCTVFPPQTQPDNSPVASPPPATLLAAPEALGPLPPLPANRAHHDLRYFLMGTASVESASGEAGKAPSVVQPSVPVAAGPVVHPCPGRYRHFKV
ncbi:alpha-2-HS-glycoprotein [Pipistrellus kuhlii]|uniref:Alpha-2-HS-glycoprotein n=1 Tax=Pipistrellus kuhlii TaxID=59472 RepID=A0A7J8A414_PIPKU|nr:alpha-2-HS-glycoprotein [Pipistrellus kuhlii]KAF6381151.1 alpha 2-HS glycoprotein [Pipistrellus kuhlii]